MTRKGDKKKTRRAGIARRKKRAVGQIGLGIMGGAFAKHLRAAGFDVSGYDLDAKRRAALVRLGGSAERSIGAVAQRARIIVTSLPSVAAVESAFFGEGGLLESAAPGTIVIETSTLPLEVKLELRDRCATRELGAPLRVKVVAAYIEAGCPEMLREGAAHDAEADLTDRRLLAAG